MNNSIAAVSCLLFAALFAVLGAVFALLKERGATLVSGFNTLPPSQRARYDRARISRDMRNRLFVWAAVFCAGAAASYFLAWPCAIAAGVVWLVLFFMEVRLDPEQAFDKYRTDPRA